jgi:choline monooxygenase
MGFERGRYLIGDALHNRGEHLVRHFHRLCHQAIRS